jgi:hypothetical protein
MAKLTHAALGPSLGLTVLLCLIGLTQVGLDDEPEVAR